jgi:hypothetical protein
MVNVDACCGAKRVHAKKLRVERQGLNADEHHSHSHGHVYGVKFTINSFYMLLVLFNAYQPAWAILNAYSNDECQCS